MAARTTTTITTITTTATRTPTERSPYVIGAIDGLTVAQLDHLFDGESNSIGALLAHIRAVEAAYQVDTFGLHQPLDDVALDLGPRARSEIRGRALDEYVRDLNAVRRVTLEEFAKRADDWLFEETPFWRGKAANNYFKWFHVFEDELNHRGQIRFLVKRLPGPRS